MTTRQKLLALSVSCLGCLAIGYYLAPAKIKIKEKIVVQEKIVKVKDTSIAKDVETVTTIEEKPDGSRTTVIKEVDKSKRVDHEASAEVRSEEVTKTKEVTRKKEAWILSAGLGAKLDDPTSKIFMGSISRRIIGPLSAGIWGTSEGRYGLGLTLSF